MMLSLGLILANGLAGTTATPTVQQAIGLRGGAIVIPLSGTPAAQIEASLTPNSWRSPSIDASAAWLRATRRSHADWSEPPFRVTVHEHEIANADAFLVASLPDTANGDMIVNGATITMTWHELPQAMPDLRRRSQPDASSAVMVLATPPLDDPTQAWRCELVAMMRGCAPPSLDRFDSLLARRVALATAGNWRYAMHRLHTRDPGVARQVADLLTATFECPEGTAAAWLTDPRSIAELLAILVGPDGAADPIAAQALRWCERQTSLLVWIESDQGESVSVSGANPSHQPRIAQVSWARPYELPLALAVPPHAMARESLQPLPERETLQLLVQVGQNHLVLPVNRAIQTIEPPGLMMGPLHPNRSLSDVSQGTSPAALPSNLQTYAQLRRLAGRWELMFECRWPAEGASNDGESVSTLLTGDHKSVSIVATPYGTVTSTSGIFGAASAHTAIHPHAWLCRLVLPEGWASSDTPSIAVMRSHAGSANVETWPTPCTPWNIRLDPAPVDLNGWNQDAATAEP